jgi:hypothetical protein
MTELQPRQIVADLTARYERLSDAELLAALEALPALPDESDASWDDDRFWRAAVFPFVVLRDLAASRRLAPAIEILLSKASFGDPGEVMRGLRHMLEAIVAPNWDVLADACIRAAVSPRHGIKLWALQQLAVLEDERARPTFEQALHHPEVSIREAAELGLRRLVRGGTC